jgi:hypothetical protein
MKLANKSLFFILLLVTTAFLAACSGTKAGTGSGTPPGGSPPPGGTPPPGSAPGGPFTIGGTVLGLKGTGLVLQNNGADDLTITATGTVPFTFKTAVPGAYAVTIKTQPSSPTQTCSVASGTGTATANVTNVQVVCAPIFTVSGTVSGLLGSGLTLQNNGADNLTVSGTGNVTFTFATPLLTGAAYAVTILTQPKTPAQTCSVMNGSGTVSGNVTNVQITCPQPGFSIGGAVVGLVPGAGNTLELQNNAGDNLVVTGNTSFIFPTPVTNGGLYNVTMFLPPTSQTQACNLFNWTGIATGNVSNVIVDCQHNDWNWISWYIPSTNTANQYAAVTTPLHSIGSLPVPNVGTPGGRDFAVTWTDKAGRKWLFGGLGYPYPSPFKTTAIPENLLNDLWVFSGGAWIPANLPMYQNKAGDWVVDPTPLESQNVPGAYGILGTASAGAAPGSRWGGSTWTDSGGNLWMFGGQGYDSTASQNNALLNDIWEWVPGGYDTHPPGVAVAGTFTGQWIWQGGSSTGNKSGVYGTQGIAAVGNLPGGRWAAASATDSTGNVWLFGGQGYDSAGKVGLLNDLWKYSPATKQWTWIGPSNSNVANQNGTYGTLGTGSGITAPGGRQNAVLWADASGNIWLFGGFGFDSAGTGTPNGAVLNDLWEFKAGQWIWVSGGGTTGIANQAGTYGTQTAAAAGNVPGSRWGAAGWIDSSNNLWFFGGWGYGSASIQPTGFLNDIWEYQASSKQWIWWKGSSGVNQQGAYISVAGVPFVNNVVGARRGAALWQPDPSGYVWVFGGEGYDSTAGAAPGYLNDLWTYLPLP